MKRPSPTWLLVPLGLLAALPVLAAENSRAKFQGLPVAPGATVTALVPLSPNEKTYAAIEGNRVPERAVAVLGVPAGFDPRKSWPILIVFSTSDSQRENRGDIPFYLSEAMEENWLVLTGDGPELPQRDTTGWRAAMTLAALDALHRSFPGSERWPVACAGISGGAKRACLLAPMLAAQGNRVIGLYLAGINDDLLAEGYLKFRPGKDFLNTKIFITSGQRDKIATPAQTERVQLLFQKDGFHRVRLEKFPEAHNVKRRLTHAALRWFQSLPSVESTESSRGLRLTAEEIDAGPGLRGQTSTSAPVPRRKQIVVTVSDSSGHASPIDASIYFVARPPGEGSRFIYAHSDISINLRGAPQAQTKIERPALPARDPKKNPPHGFVFTGGGEATGWVVVAQANGKTFATRFSDPALLDASAGRSADSLDAMIADYRKRLQATTPQ